MQTIKKKIIAMGIHKAFALLQLVTEHSSCKAQCPRCQKSIRDLGSISNILDIGNALKRLIS